MLPNQNTNNNLVCETGASFQGFIFDGSNNDPSMAIVKGADTLINFSLKDVFMPADSWYTQEFTVKAGMSVIIDGDNIANSIGDAQFITLLVTYPQADQNRIVLDTTEKYIQFTYPRFGSGTYNIGKIMMLSGTTKVGSG